MGAVAMNTATREVDDITQRTRVANAAWYRWAPFTAMSIAAHLGGVVLGRGRAAVGGPVETVRAAVTLAALAATTETGRSGRVVVAAGDVPVADAVTPISSTPPDVAAAQRRLRVAQWAVPALTGLLWVVEAVDEG